MKPHTHINHLKMLFVLLTGLLSGCSGTNEILPIDESGYVGMYTGYHYLVDSNNLKPIINDPNLIYQIYDTLTVSRGTDSTDGVVYASSSYLSGKTFEVNTTLPSNNVTPIFLGDLKLQYITLTNSKVDNGSHATWTTDKTHLNTFLLAGATYGPIVLPPVLKLNGDFVKN
jgi:hypothetical protein